MHYGLLIALLLRYSLLLGDIPQKGRPYVQYYSPKDYRAGSNTYNVVRDSLGVFYFSNDEGVLMFDGSEWSLIPIELGKSVYWVEIADDGTVLVASTGEIGYLDHLPNGQKIYRSLMHSGGETVFENVWEIAVTSRGSVFRSKKLLFHYFEGKVTTIPTNKGIFDVALAVRDTVYVRIYGEGLFYLSDKTLVPVPGGDFFADIKLNSYLPYEDQLLIATRSMGLFLLGDDKVEPFPSEADAFFRKYRIYDGCMTQSGNYAYAAYIKGVAIIDKNGQLLQIIDEEAGLPKHQYLYVGAYDPSSLWITHAVGMSRVEILSPTTYFDEAFGLNDVVTSINIHQNTLYVTTLEGFYEYSSAENRFLQTHDDFLEEFHGITVINDELFVGGQLGLMKYEEGKLHRLTHPMIHEFSVSRDGKLILAGSGEGGFDVIRQQHGTYELFSLEGFTEQIKKIIPTKDGAIVVTHFGQLVRIDIDETERLGIKSSMVSASTIGNFDAVKVDDKLLVITPNGWKLLNQEGQEEVAGNLPTANKVSKIQVTSDAREGVFWVCYENEKRLDYCEQWRFENKALKGTNMVFKSGYRINTIFQGKDGIDWFGGDEGVIRFDPSKALKQENTSMECRISTISIPGDSVLSRYGYRPENISLSYENASIAFSFYSDHSFLGSDEVLFQFRLLGLGEQWSEWTYQTSKEYSNLAPNEYTFQVRARNSLGQRSEIDEVRFEVSTPWYLSSLSVAGYVLILVIMVYGYTRWRTKNLKESKKQLEKLVEGRTREVEAQKKFLEVQSETLRQANATKDQLFSIIGHDLRGPLSSIHGLTELIKHYRAEKQPEKVDEMMDQMNDSVKRLRHLLDNLLSWALNQSGNFKVKKELVRLRYLIMEVIGIVRDTAQSKEIDLIVEVEENLELIADANSIGTILRNLVSNAIKFTHHGGKVWVTAKASEDGATVEIRDNGVGIPKEKVSEVFQLSDTTYGTSNEKGTGLGLVLVEEFVKLNGGHMSVESEVNSGTSFLIEFPSN